MATGILLFRCVPFRVNDKRHARASSPGCRRMCETSQDQLDISSRGEAGQSPFPGTMEHDGTMSPSQSHCSQGANVDPHSREMWMQKVQQLLSHAEHSEADMVRLPRQVCFSLSLACFDCLLSRKFAHCRPQSALPAPVFGGMRAIRVLISVLAILGALQGVKHVRGRVYQHCLEAIPRAVKLDKTPRIHEWHAPLGGNSTGCPRCIPLASTASWDSRFTMCSSLRKGGKSVSKKGPLPGAGVMPTHVASKNKA